MSYLGPISSNTSQIINYISNNKATDNTLSWGTYADAAAAQPVDGTGGSPNITWNRDLTSPLRGIADFTLIKDAVNRQGQGVSVDFTINNADLAKVLSISFDYELISGTYATGDLAVYLIQDPAGTPVVIQPAGYQVQSASTGTKTKQIATFQTASNVTSYRLCIHVASVSASAYTLAFDNFVVGPQTVQYGAPVTDWQSYTPIFTGFGTVSTQTFWWRRVGDSVEIKGRFVSGTSTATEARVSLPSITSAGSDRIATIEIAGVAEINTIGTVGQNVGVSLAVLTEQSVGYVTFSARSSGNTGLTKLQGTGIIASGSVMTLEAKLPITGWSSTVQMSNDTDTRVVAASYYMSTNTAASATAPINFNTQVFDTHGAVTTGAGWNFKAPVPGYYSVSVYVYAPGVNATYLIHKNASGTGYISVAEHPSGEVATGKCTIYLNGGESIDVRPNVSTTVTGNTLSGSAAKIHIERLSGPSAIAASETVAASYWKTTNQSISNTTTPINFDAKEYDTHGAVTTGASWKFTAPISGKYEISAYISNGTASTEYISLHKNGSVNKIANFLPASTATNAAASLDLLAGEYVDLKLWFGLSAITINGNSTQSGGVTASRIQIKRIGN